jgi:hypothetical protein
MSRHQQYRDKGMCGSCGKVPRKKGICRDCKTKQRERESRMREKRKAEGLCQRCGKRKVERPDDFYCAVCRKVHSLRTIADYYRVKE